MKYTRVNTYMRGYRIQPTVGTSFCSVRELDAALTILLRMLKQAFEMASYHQNNTPWYGASSHSVKCLDGTRENWQRSLLPFDIDISLMLGSQKAMLAIAIFTQCRHR